MSQSCFSGSWSSLPNGREVTVLEIRCPITHAKKNGRKYTDFEICVKSNSKAFSIPRSSVRRRYSDFVWLRNWLQENNEGFSSQRKTPSLPPKKIIGRFDDAFIEHRMRGLQRFLRKVVEHNVFLSDKALHLFLQSNMSVKQIESYLTGEPVDFEVNKSIPRELMHEDYGMNNENAQKHEDGIVHDNSQLLQGIREDTTQSETLYENQATSLSSQFAYESFDSLPLLLNRVVTPLLSICAAPEPQTDSHLSCSEERSSASLPICPSVDQSQHVATQDAANEVIVPCDIDLSGNPLSSPVLESANSDENSSLEEDLDKSDDLSDCLLDVNILSSTSDDKCSLGNGS